MKTIQQTCKCGVKYFAREADIKRGWGKSCSKRCAAVKRTKRELSGNHKLAAASVRYRGRDSSDFSIGSRNWNEAQSASEMGWDAHKSD